MQLRTDELGRLVRPQLLRAATGVAANYRAAGRSRSRREFAARLGVVVEEADEAELWLDILGARGCGLEEVAVLQSEAIQLRAIFAKSRATALENIRRQRAKVP